MRDTREEEERQAFGELDAAEQEAIRFLLACGASRRGFVPIRHELWLADRNPWVLGFRLAAYNVLGNVPLVAEKLANIKTWGNPEAFFGGAVNVAVFCLCNGFIRTFNAFDFLFVHLLGGAVRPFIPSLFAAALLHPRFSPDAISEQELVAAMVERQHGCGTLEPAWFPKEPVPPLEIIPDYRG